MAFLSPFFIPVTFSSLVPSIFLLQEQLGYHQRKGAKGETGSLKQEKVRDRSGRREERNQRRKEPDQSRKGKREGRELRYRESWLCLRGLSAAPPKDPIDIGQDSTDVAAQLNQGVLFAVLYLPLLDSRLNDHR